MELTQAETDGMFEPFDPMDGDLPIHMLANHHRFILQHVYDWLQQNVGDVDHLQWRSDSNSSGTRTFLFRSARHAMMFKLAFSEPD